MLGEWHRYALPAFIDRMRAPGSKTIAEKAINAGPPAADSPGTPATSPAATAQTFTPATCSSPAGAVPTLRGNGRAWES